MTITSVIVLFAVIWFLTLFVVLPIGMRTQGEAGDVTPGTPSSAPAEPRMRRKFALVTVIAVLIWAPLCAFIVWGGVSVRDLDVWRRM
jgi:predicted secreted protein